MSLKTKAYENKPGFAMTSMIDVVFLLLIFFLCATKFKQLEQKLDTFLPITDGVDLNHPPSIKPEELTIYVKDDPLMRGSASFDVRVRRKATYFLASRDARPIRDVNEFIPTLRQLARNPEQSVLIALYDEKTAKDQRVPFFNIVQVIDACKYAGISYIKFQAPGV